MKEQGRMKMRGRGKKIIVNDNRLILEGEGDGLQGET